MNPGIDAPGVKISPTLSVTSSHHRLTMREKRLPETTRHRAFIFCV